MAAPIVEGKKILFGEGHEVKVPPGWIVEQSAEDFLKVIDPEGNSFLALDDGKLAPYRQHEGDGRDSALKPGEWFVSLEEAFDPLAEG
jgi:hypothetical protein